MKCFRLRWFLMNETSFYFNTDIFLNFFCPTKWNEIEQLGNYSSQTLLHKSSNEYVCTHLWYKAIDITPTAICLFFSFENLQNQNKNIFCYFILLASKAETSSWHLFISFKYHSLSIHPHNNSFQWNWSLWFFILFKTHLTRALSNINIFSFY